MRYISARIRFGASVAVNVEKFAVAAKMLRLRRRRKPDVTGKDYCMSKGEFYEKVRFTDIGFGDRAASLLP
jgi:hypothetical protein